MAGYMEAENDADGVSALTVAVKEEPIDEYTYENRPVEFVNVDKSTNAAVDHFVDDIEIGETHVSNLNDNSDGLDTSIKTENITAGDSGVDRENHRTSSTGTRKRKSCIETQQVQAESSKASSKNSHIFDSLSLKNSLPSKKRKQSASPPPPGKGGLVDKPEDGGEPQALVNAMDKLSALINKAQKVPSYKIQMMGFADRVGCLDGATQRRLFRTFNKLLEEEEDKVNN